jgi:hypothetical protein
MQCELDRPRVLALMTELYVVIAYDVLGIEGTLHRLAPFHIYALCADLFERDCRRYFGTMVQLPDIPCWDHAGWSHFFLQHFGRECMNFPEVKEQLYARFAANETSVLRTNV